MGKTKRRLRAETECSAWVLEQLLKKEIEQHRERTTNALPMFTFHRPTTEIPADVLRLRSWMQSIEWSSDASNWNPQETLSSLTDDGLWSLATEEHSQLSTLARAEIAKRNGLIQDWKYLGPDGFRVIFTIETKEPLEEIVRRIIGGPGEVGTIHGETYSITPYWQPTHIIRIKLAGGESDTFEVMLLPSGEAPIRGEFVTKHIGTTWHLTEEGWTYNWTLVPDGPKGEHRITKLNVELYALDIEEEDKPKRNSTAKKPKRRQTSSHQEASAVDPLTHELRIKNVNIPDLPKKLRLVFMNELSRCLTPHVHEGKIPAYGAALLRNQALIDRALRSVPFPSQDEDSMIKLATGEQALVAHNTVGERFLLIFKDHIGSEATLVKLSAETDAVILRRTSTNETCIYDKGNVTIHKDRQWSFKGNAKIAVRQATQQAPMIDSTFLQELVDYAYHELSPRRIGATLVWLLKDTQIEGGHALGMELNITSTVDRHLLADYLDQTDGATIVSSNGLVERVGVQLSYTEKAREIIKEIGGTRHTSARRFSFDRPETIVVVVSADGPVSLFSDGLTLATLATKSFASVTVADALRKAAPVKANDVSHDDWEEVCTNCGKKSIIDRIVIDGWKEHETANCPVCGEEIASANCFTIDATPLKSLPS